MHPLTLARVLMSKSRIESEYYPLLASMVAKSASVMVCITNEEKERVFLNDSWLAYTGKTLADELEREWTSSIHPDDIQRCVEVFDQAFERKKNYRIDYRLQRADGAYRWVRDEGAAYINANGEFKGFSSSCYEIHEEAEARSLIERREKLYKETIDGLLVGVVVHAPDTSILLCNIEASNILGLSEDQIRGKQAIDPEWRFVYPNRDPIELPDYPVNKVISTREALYNYEVGVVRPERSYITWVIVNAKPLFDVSGKLEQIVINFADITARRQAEDALEASEYELLSHIKNMPMGCISWDENFCCTDWNPAAEQIFGYTAEEAIGTHAADFLLPSSARPVVDDIFSLLMEQKGGAHSINENLTKDQRVIICDWHNTPIISKEGKPVGVTSLVQDITETKKNAAQLSTQSQITANMQEGAYLVRASDQTIVYANSAFEKMFGYGPGEMLGKHVSIVNAPSDKSPEETAAKVVSELEKSGVWRGEIENIKKNGTHFWCSATVSSFDHPEFGNVWISVHTDITERRALDRKLSYQSSHDALTGLISRFEFERRAKTAIGSISDESTAHAMCFIDLDQFKVINDTCGHAAGDELLRQLGRTLKSVVGEGDTLARLGGDEFAVLIENCTLLQARKIAQDILDAITDFQFLWESKSFRIGASIGLVAIDHSTESLTSLFKNADAACYLAKDLGRNRIHIYNRDDNDLALRHGEMQWVAQINEALENNHFLLYAQPIVPIKKGTHRHYELLIRLRDEQGSIVPPGAFLPAAERYNLIQKIDYWVVEEVTRFFRSAPEFFVSIDFVTINLSGASLTHEGFLDFILAQVRKGVLRPEKICFEITETVAVSNLNSATEFIVRLKEEGFRFALDDFGSGISSFGYLKTLPVDYLKIDGIFIKDIVDDPIDFAMVKAINEIGHLMGIETIAEFVENDEIASKLATIDVDYGQGYGLGKPEALTDVIRKTLET